jgi:beta-ribofuranosylaminobenzene 5'-phosphate synthase
LVNEIARLRHVLDREKSILKLSTSIHVEIEGDLPTHFGLGSSTAIRLGCMEALYILNNLKPKSENLIMSSGRGGTSGIGINTYFLGGFIVDLGKKTDQSPHCPSSTAEDRSKLPLMMQRVQMPEWEIGICIPRSIIHKTEEEEKEFFDRTCPIPQNKVYEILYNIIFGVYAAVKENDKQTFSLAIRRIQKTAWKFAERTEYGKSLLEIENKLYKFGATSVGMSSLGPSLFYFADG